MKVFKVFLLEMKVFKVFLLGGTQSQNFVKLTFFGKIKISKNEKKQNMQNMKNRDQSKDVKISQNR